MATITAANSVFLLTIPGLFPTPQLLQGYAADDAFATDGVEPSEVVMGVDGRMSAGYTPYMTKQTIMIMPDSLSIVVFEAWLAAMKAAQEVYPANGVITLPGLGKRFTLLYGILTNSTPISSVKKVMQAQSFGITWRDVNAVPI